jgi:hypothetical protein
MTFSIEIKKNTALVVTASFLLALAPLSASALEIEERSAVNAERKAAAFCEKLDDAEDRVLAKLSERKGKIDRSTAIKAKKDARIAAFEEKKENKIANREARYAKLTELAKTDEQKEAVENFVNTVKDLADARHETVKDAIEAFEDEITNLAKERNDSADSRAREVESTIGGIFDDARASCEDGSTPAEVRTQLKADMTSMQTDLKAKHEDRGQNEDLVNAREVRKTIMAEAKATFLEGYKAAKADLRAIFSQ